MEDKQLEERNKKEAYLLYMRISTLQNKLQPKTPIIYRNTSQLLDHVKEIEKKFDKNPGGHNYKMGHSPETYERIFKKLKELREKKKPKQDEIIDTHQSNFMTKSISKSNMIYNIHKKQEQEIFDKMKEAQYFEKREAHFNINNHFIKNWNNNFEKFKQRLNKKQNAQIKQQNFGESLKCSFGNSVILDNYSVQEDFYKNVNDSVLEYAIYKNQQQHIIDKNSQSMNRRGFENNFSKNSYRSNEPMLISQNRIGLQHKQQSDMMMRQMILIKQFVYSNNNKDIFSCLKIFEEQFKKIKESDIKQDNKLSSIKTSCEILENNFSKRIKPVSNIPYINGASGQIRNVNGYLTQDYLLREIDIRSKVQFINRVPFWALIYMSLRAGFTKDLKEFLNNFEDEGNQDIIQIRNLINHEGENLIEYQNPNLNLGSSNEIFRDLLQFIFGKIELYEEFPFDEIWDYLWIWLKRSYYNSDYLSVLKTLQNNLNSQRKDQDYSLSTRLSLLCFTLQYEDMLGEMAKNPQSMYQAMIFYYIMLETKFVDDEKITLNSKFDFKNQFVNFVIDICNDNSLRGLSYLSCYTNDLIFAQSMFKVFKNNEKLLNEYFGLDSHHADKLQELKSIFSKKKLNCFYDFFLKNFRQKDQFYLQVWYVRIIQEKREMEKLTAEALKATAAQIYQIVRNDKQNQIPSYYQSTIDYIEKIQYSLLGCKEKDQLSNHNEFRICNNLKNLIKRYKMTQIQDLEFLQKIKEGKYFDVDINKMQKSSVYIYYEMIRLTLQAIEHRLQRLTDRITERSVLTNMKMFLDQIIRFLDESFYPMINYNQIDCFEFDAKKAGEQIDDLLNSIEKYFYRI